MGVLTLQTSGASPRAARMRQPGRDARERHGTAASASSARVASEPNAGEWRDTCEAVDGPPRMADRLPPHRISRKVLWSLSEGAGTARPHLLRISGARKSVVAVAVAGGRCVLLNVRYAPVSTKFRSAAK
jgi:hypothetical protein